ncbi:unnamed protein product [Prunus brigantina]
MHFRNVETVFSRPERNDDGGEANAKLSVFSQNVRPFNGYKFLQLSEGEMEPIYWYILDNCEEIEPFRKYSLYVYRMCCERNSVACPRYRRNSHNSKEWGHGTRNSC